MTRDSARSVTNFLGWCLLSAAILQIPGMIAGGMLAGMGMSSLLFFMSWGLMLLLSSSALGLLFVARIGFYLLYVATFLSFVGPRGNFVPFVARILPAGPEKELYLMLFNLAFVAIAMFCHWSLARDNEESSRKRTNALLATVAILIIPGFIYWKAGNLTARGEAPNAAAVPFIGDQLATLQTTSPIAYRSHELTRLRSGTIVLSGSTTETNLAAFAAAHDLKLMTNVAARVKFLPVLKTWKLDPETFPLINGENDRCYIGRLPKDSKLIFQICHRPATGQFTAMAMGRKP